MAHHIEVELSPDDLSAVDVGHKDRFTIPVRASKKIAKRIEDTAAASVYDGLGIVPNGDR